MRQTAIIRIGAVTAVVLLVPLVAMQFTDEVDWAPGDFVAAGALVIGAGLTYELLARRGDSVAYRATVGIAVAAVLLLVWAILAVGL